MDVASPLDRRFVGIDLASQANRTGVVVVTRSGREAHAGLPLEDLVADDPGLVSIVDERTVVGLDAPLGWPDDFVTAVVAHRGGKPWPTFQDQPGDKIRESLRKRRTDLFVQSLDLGSTPLSVSSDLIGVVAMRAALLQSLWASKWGQREPRDGSGQLVETYPAAALRAWGFLPRRGVRYKGGGSVEQRAAQGEVRDGLMESIATRSAAWLMISKELRQAATNSDHVLDALVCALVALAARARGTHAPPTELADVARREGWIHVPSGTFEDLGSNVRGK